MDLIGAFLLVLGCVVLCQMAGFAGSVYTNRGLAWYRLLVKPRFTPSGRFIAIMWTALFTLMGISLFLVLRAGLEGDDIAVPVVVFGSQLFTNVYWNYVFFAANSPTYGLVAIATLLALIVLNIFVFWTVSPLAAILLLPYIAWVTVAAVLNGAVFVMNPKDRKERSPRR